MNIIYKNKNFIVVEKPAGIPSQSDKSGDADAMKMTSEELKRMGEPPELWLVHRLDRVVGGLLVFARNKASAAELSSIVSTGEMKKKYIAVAEGAPEGGLLKDFIYKDAKAGKAFVVSGERRGVKEALLDCKALRTTETERGRLTLVEIDLITGRFHQIRVQLSSRGFPIVGDGKYGSRDNGARFPALFATELSFTFKRCKYNFSKRPDTREYPWNIFSEDIERNLA